MHELLCNAYFDLTVDRAVSVIYFKRKPVPFETVDECDRLYAEVVRIFSALDRPRFKLLVDLRDGPSRNDPAFERVLAMHRRNLFMGFSRAVVLVQTAAGILQIARHAREDDLEIFAFTDEAWANKCLFDDPPPR